MISVWFTIQQLLRRTDNTGRVSFSTAEHDWITQEEGQSFKDFLAEHVLAYMDGHSGFMTRFETVKSSVKELEIRANPIAESPHYQVSFNVSRMVRLPGVDPVAEVRELCEFFDTLKPFFEKHASDRPRVLVTNNRDGKGKTYGLLDCRYKPAGENGTSAVEFTEAAMGCINASDVLTAWLKQLALDLNKVGPLSWLNFHHEQLFEEWEDPVLRRRRMSA